MKTRSVRARLLLWLRKSKIRTRLLVVFLILSLLPGTLLALLANRIYATSITEKTTQTSQQMMQLMNNNLQFILKEYSGYIDKLSVYAPIHEFLYNRLLDPAYSNSSLIGDMMSRDTLFEVLYNDVTVRDVFIIDANWNFVANTGYVSYSQPAVDQVLAATDQLSPRDYISSYTPSYGVDCLAMCRKIYDNRFTHTHVGYILLLFENAAFQKSLFPTSAFGEGASIFLMNSTGHLVSQQSTQRALSSEALSQIFSQVDTQITTNGYTAVIPDDTNLILYTVNQDYRLYSFTSIPSALLNAEILWIERLILGVTFVLLFLCLLLSTAIYRSIIRPINQIISVCEQPKEAGAVCLIEDPADDELGYLAHTIDTMTQNNARMLETIHQQDQQKRELEIEMLKYQLNPHFLFNTLNTFKWIASINGLSTLSDGVTALANLLRNTLTSKDELVTLTAEISTLKDYCSIQNLRYAGQFHISFFIEEAAANCRIPRFLLQPLIENAILHGSTGLDSVLEISVSCHIAEQTLHIIVQDNGTGFCVEDVFDAQQDRFTGIGLSNIDARLQLYYGKATRLKVISKPGAGTLCQIFIPAERT